LIVRWLGYPRVIRVEPDSGDRLAPSSAPFGGFVPQGPIGVTQPLTKSINLGHIGMQDLLRQEIATAADTVVVKVGTRVLTDANGRLDRERIATLAEELNEVIEGGRRVALVSSGAVGAGMGRLDLDRRPTDLAHLQAVAAIGQSHLVEAYDEALRIRGRHAAQVLLTAEDLDHRTRYLNVRNTIVTLMQYGAVPIINENDTVAVDELLTTFGDNDRLAAMVTNLIRAPLLVILSDVAGLYDGDPEDSSSNIIPTVTELDESVMRLDCGEASANAKRRLSKGGMTSKLQAARLATAAGENVILADGHAPGTLAKILVGEQIGTLFVAEGQSVQSRKRWIGFTANPRGTLSLDAGACRALAEQGRSLLAIGITKCEGEFDKGDIVSLVNEQGDEIARGLTNYSAAEILRIQGLKTDQIADVLSHCPYDEVIHRDNLMVTA